MEKHAYNLLVAFGGCFFEVERTDVIDVISRNYICSDRILRVADDRLSANECTLAHQYSLLSRRAQEPAVLSNRRSTAASVRICYECLA